MPVTATFNDPTGRYTAQAELMIRNAVAGFDAWAFGLAPFSASIEIDFHLVTNFANRGGGRSYTSQSIGTLNGRSLLSDGVAFEIRTGIDPNGAAPDLEVFFDVDFLTRFYWVNPFDGSRPPAGMTDLVSVIAHEVGHALGFNGFRNSVTSELAATVLSTFDSLVEIAGGKPYFVGANAMAQYGGPVPLTQGNLFHLGNSGGPGAELTAHLMNGIVLAAGRPQPTLLDVAVLSDTGLPTIFNDVLPGSNGADTMRGGSGDDTINGGAGNDIIRGDEGRNYLRGDLGDDSVVGGAGFDDINGNQGNDTCISGGGDDWVVGGKDNDSLVGSDGQNLVYGNLGSDTLDGGAGNDIVRGGQDNDVLTGGAGDDFVSGDRGYDTMSGGGGADVFHTFGETGIDRVLDFNLAEGDRVQLDPGTQFTVSQVGADTVIAMSGGGQMLLVGVSMGTLTGAWIFGA